MPSKAWISLLQTIPPDKFEKLVLVSASGNEVTIQSILRIEEEYMVVMARLAGTTDDPRVMLIPLDNIDYLGFREPLKTSEIEAIFGRGLGLDGQGAPAPRPSVQGAVPAAASTEPEAEKPEGEEEAEPVKKQKPAILSALLKPAAAPEQPAAPTPPPPAPEPAAPAAAADGGPLLPGKAALLERLRKSRQGQK